MDFFSCCRTVWGGGGAGRREEEERQGRAAMSMLIATHQIDPTASKMVRTTRRTGSRGTAESAFCLRVHLWDVQGSNSVGNGCIDIARVRSPGHVECFLLNHLCVVLSTPHPHPHPTPPRLRNSLTSSQRLPVPPTPPSVCCCFVLLNQNRKQCFNCLAVRARADCLFRALLRH